MIFNFNLFTNEVKRIYSGYKQYPLELNEVLEIFKTYFERYESVMRVPHPFISQGALIKILDALPYVYDELSNSYIDLFVDDYKLIIDKHFSTRYRFCDFNIVHFFSGKIRLLRYYEI